MSTSVAETITTFTPYHQAGNKPVHLEVPPATRRRTAMIRLLADFPKEATAKHARWKTS